MTTDVKPYQTLDLEQIDGIELPPQQWLVPNAISHPSLGMLIARRGVGKTWFSLHLGLSIAAGAQWSNHFPACKRRGVLYVDGEMALPDIVGRVQSMPHGGDFFLLNGERLAMQRDSMNLAEAEDRERLLHTMADIERETGTPIDLLMLDNWSSLVFGLDENSNSELDDIRRWMIELRHLEVSVILVHHIGKGEGQRGASAREDQLNYTVKLDQMPDHESQTTGLEAVWEKCRGPRPVPDRLYFDITNDGGRVRIVDRQVMKVV